MWWFYLCRAKQQNLEERQADVEYELRCLLNKPGGFTLTVFILFTSYCLHLFTYKLNTL